MDLPPAPKRRRLNDALHKPFKSPLRGPPKPPANPPAASPLSGPHTNSAHSSSSSKKSTLPAANRVGTATATQARTPNPAPAPAPADADVALALAAANKDIRRMEAAMIRRRQEIDTLQHALAIVSSPKGAELDALALKWRRAARLAAEEVFAGARDKVNRMGGVGAWRERESERRGFGSAWDAEPVRNEDRDEDGEGEDEGGGEERDERVEEEGWEYDRKAQEEEEEQQQGADGGADDDSFTMDMMLKTMNIDLELIGYDRRRQMWVG